MSFLLSFDFMITPKLIMQSENFFPVTINKNKGSSNIWKFVNTLILIYIN